MKRLTCVCLISAFAIAAGPRLAAADGMNVARFLVNNQLKKRAPKVVRPFDRAFNKLRAAARSRAFRGSKPVVLLSQSKRQRIAGPAIGGRRTTMKSKRELIFDGKRAYLKLTTSSKGLRPQTTTSTVRVPLGRLFGWYGKKLVQASFGDLTPQQIQRGLSKLQPRAKQPLGARVNAFFGEAYAAFGRTVAK